MNDSTALELTTTMPEVGQIVRVRSRRWLVEDVVPASQPGDSAIVSLACAEEDAQGEALTVYWDYELDRRILEEENWHELGRGGFDDPREFAAFLHTLRWGCVTATDPTLFQSPFRAGIQIDPYQMEPLRKALQLPRVNIFIADDTGLGKTIEAGLIAQELLLRKKIKNIVVSAPPSVLDQWKRELEERFGLVFEVLDRQYMARVRRERGFGVNPWKTHSRFLISHRLLIDETYAGPMRDWLDEMREAEDAQQRPGSLLVLDEAHHAAPASGSRYGIESKFTRAVRDLAWRFEHRVFLSATPHNGHSSSFSTLLEILDPTRFTRGVKIKGKGELEKVMVRRLKEDIRRVQGGFPERKVVRLVLDNLPEDTPELVLSKLLDEYRTLREERHRKGTRSAQAAAVLPVVGLQQRLLSSIEAFARSLPRHIDTVEKQWRKGGNDALPAPAILPDRFLRMGEPDDEDYEDDSFGAETEEPVEENGPDAAEAEQDAEEAAEECRQLALLEELADVEGARDAALFAQERALLDRMKSVAEEARYVPDVKMRRLFAWMRENLCSGLPEEFGDDPAPNAVWTDRRVLVFTENRQGTKTALRNFLRAYIEGTPDAEQRIAILDGTTPARHRKEIQRRFNADPATEPLRILLATDAAREGLNFQAHCQDLFHFDLPWNPGRLEQRNGRIDRKLQPADEVRCHYFVLPQRVEDHVLEVLVRKTETIQRELGSLSKVLEVDMEKALKHGIAHRDAERLREQLEGADLDEERRRVTEEELEAARDRETDLRDQIQRCGRLLEKSRDWVRFRPDAFREALSCSLQLQNLDPLRPLGNSQNADVWEFPAAQKAERIDPTWRATLDTLRTPRKPDQPLAKWRQEAPIRPVVFKDAGTLQEETVHLHLQQRVAQRLLSRFRSQGFLHHDLSRACLAQAKDSIPRVILLGRLALYGTSAERLHEEVVPVAARWLDPALRKGSLKAYARDAEGNALEMLEEAISSDAAGAELPPDAQERLLASAERDVAELRPQLEPRAAELAAVAREKLRARGDREAQDFLETLRRQRAKVEKALADYEKGKAQLLLQFDAAEEKRQVEENARSWEKRLEVFLQEEKEEPDRIRARYEVRAVRVEPIGLIYLWPRST